MDTSTVKPCLKIVGLHVEGFRALRRLDWPADGTGWSGAVPDMVVVGGVNGSGKTTLLELIAEAARCLLISGHRSTTALSGTTARADLALTRQGKGRVVFSWIVGGESLPDRQGPDGPMRSYRQDRFDTAYVSTSGINALSSLLASISDAAAFAESDLPGVVYLPTDRGLSIPDESYKAPGKLSVAETFFYRFAPARQWKDSIEALLYSARWADLNAKEEGYPERATHFESYARAFQAFFGDAKHLVWEGGELFVKIADTGALHPLMELSSGEKQALILAAELYRRWRPGSLILIDEPELHFHASWQTALYSMLERWQKERGGQVIIATQSNHIFRIAAPGTTVLLGGPLA